ncbi:hypothetical protein I250019C1_23730 [Faecalibacterium sp. i25-0019-C1]
MQRFNGRLRRRIRQQRTGVLRYGFRFAGSGFFIVTVIKSVQRQKKVNLRWGQDRFCIGRYRNRQRAIGRNDILW